MSIGDNGVGSVSKQRIDYCKMSLAERDVELQDPPLFLKRRGLSLGPERHGQQRLRFGTWQYQGLNRDEIK